MDLFAKDIKTGKTLWTFPTDKYTHSAPTIAENVVYTEREGTLFAFEAMTGERLWEWSPHTRELSEAVLSEGVLYISDFDGNLYALR